jgi:hypothetical protein
MINSESWVHPAGGDPDVTVQGSPNILAAALVQLLGRDEELPARWLSVAFDHEVQLHRADMRTVTSPVGLRSIGPASGVGSPFRSAVIGLTRDPADVAVAIRHLEILHGQALPPWRDLVRRGIPTGFADADASPWFG